MLEGAEMRLLYWLLTPPSGNWCLTVMFSVGAGFGLVGATGLGA